MGWSCSAIADETYRKLTDAMVTQTGIQNIWLSGGNAYMLETSRIEHPDGAITGTILRFIVPEGINLKDDLLNAIRQERTQVQKVGSFRIDGYTGNLVRSGFGLKELISCKVTKTIKVRGYRR